MLLEHPRKRPSVVAVEINLIVRQVDQELVREFRGVNLPLTMLKPASALVALYERRDHHYSRKVDILRLPVAAQRIVDPRAVAQTLGQYTTPGIDDAIRKSAAVLKTLVEALEADNMRVYLFEMPVLPLVAQTPLVRTTRLVVSQVLGSDRQLQMDYPAAELRWDDPEHLDDRSSVIVAAALERALASKLAFRPR